MRKLNEGIQKARIFPELKAVKIVTSSLCITEIIKNDSGTWLAPIFPFVVLESTTRKGRYYFFLKKAGEEEKGEISSRLDSLEGDINRVW